MYIFEAEAEWRMLWSHFISPPFWANGKPGKQPDIFLSIHVHCVCIYFIGIHSDGFLSPEMGCCRFKISIWKIKWRSRKCHAFSLLLSMHNFPLSKSSLKIIAWLPHFQLQNVVKEYLQNATRSMTYI